MTSKPIELEPYHHAYACACRGWKCFICNGEANDQIGIQDQFLADYYVVFTDGIDGTKWVFCMSCKKAYHLQCVTSESEQQIHAKGWHSPVHLMNVKEKQIKRVTNPRFINWVSNWVTIFGLPFNFYSMKQSLV